LCSDDAPFSQQRLNIDRNVGAVPEDDVFQAFERRLESFEFDASAASLSGALLLSRSNDELLKRQCSARCVREK
jgi:hypothetical protein